MVSICRPDQSDEIHQEILAIEEEIFRELGLHFRTMDMPVEDLGAPAYRKFDIEAWMPSREDFGEISSVSNCTDYQSRRLGIRYKENGENHFAHTLNGTAVAVPRILLAILENFQQKDGRVIIPEVLHPFTFGIKEILPKKQTTD
eukprot:TRINITY_DN2105_c0_g1_i2.p1 TRINITY_DN2105_c0_g1~~TRINITY_DN2105_c0_g1_i2.p1  ORF type:complete len:145 (-),score=22.50 TRINITY_DN2105_c0_g1_i2:47-481(-)